LIYIFFVRCYKSSTIERPLMRYRRVNSVPQYSYFIVSTPFNVGEVWLKGGFKMGKKKVSIWALVLGVFIMYILPGCCLTAKLGDKIRKKSSPFHEFKDVKQDCSSLKINTGAYVGETQLNWTSYRTYQFGGILKGEDDGRILEILIPFENKEKKKMAILREPLQEGKAVSPAYLFVKDRNAKAGCKEQLAPFEETFKQEHPNHGLILNDDPYRELYYTVSDNDETGGKQWVPILTDSDLNWLNRDKEEVSWLKLRYLYTVPLDIVLFPLCLLGFFSGSG